MSKRQRAVPAAVSTMSTHRLAHLDNLKVVLTSGVIVAHAAMTYGAAGTWVYEEEGALSPVASVVLGAFVGLGVMFGLGLFFLMAGMLTTAPLTRRGPRRFLRSRLGRLGLPLAAYALVVWPVLRWLVDRAEGDPASLVTSYRRQLSGDRWRSLGTGPLWFVAILLVVTTLWTLWRWLRPAPVRAAPPLQMRHLAMTAGAVAAGTFVVRVWFPVDSEQFLDAHVWIWPQAGALFVLGALATERGWLMPLSDLHRRVCRNSAILAVATLVVLIFLSDGPEPFKGGWHWEAAGFAVFEGIFSVSVSLAVLDWFRRHHARQGAIGRVLARAAYGAFVVQGPVLVLAALSLRPTTLPGDVKFVLLALVAVTGSFGVAAGGTAVRRELTRRAHRSRSRRRVAGA